MSSHTLFLSWHQAQAASRRIFHIFTLACFAMKGVPNRSKKRKTSKMVSGTTGRRCPNCSRTLSVKRGAKDSAVATIYGSETIEQRTIYRSRCKGCNTTVRGNLWYSKGKTYSGMTFNELEEQGFYLVSAKTGFTMPYLRLAKLRLMRAKCSPGQEAVTKSLFHQGDDRMVWQSHTFRDHMLHAMEGYTITSRTPMALAFFDTAFPSVAVTDLEGPLLFPPPNNVKELAFDGMFGVHRTLHKSEPPRTVARKGRPRKAKGPLPTTRSCSCARKDGHRLAMGGRTGGWQFVVDPNSRRVLAAKEHKNNENNDDKVAIIKKVLAMDNMNVDVLIHDDACHFEKYVKKRSYKFLLGVKYYVIDIFHMPNHKCSKRKWTRREKKRMRGVRTNMSESFNGWIRGFNFFLNSLRPHSHRFWLEELCRFYNANLKDIPIRITRRSTAASRALQKKPARA